MENETGEISSIPREQRDDSVLIQRNVYLTDCSADQDCQDEDQRRQSKRPCILEHWEKLSNNEDNAMFSDWKVTVHQNSKTQKESPNLEADSAVSATYLVHRLVLGSQSDYFKRMFLGHFSESSENQSSLTLTKEGVGLEHFETILDYLYTGQLTLVIENAVAILFLCDYFGIKKICKLVESFIRKILKNQVLANVETHSHELALLYKESMAIGVEDLQHAIVVTCSKNPKLLYSGTSFADMADMNFWRCVLKEKRMNPVKDQDRSRQWSEAIWYFVERTPGITDLKSFHELTNADYLPVISPSVAVHLMKQEHNLNLKEESLSAIRPTMGEYRYDDLTCLQTRCIEALYSRSGNGDQHFLLPTSLGRLETRKLPSIALENMLFRTSQYFPKAVVRGAGTASVDGVYTMAGWFSDAMYFTRASVHESLPTSFGIYRAGNRWMLSNLTVDTIFYQIDVQRELQLPPSSGWSTGEGIFPAPTVQIVANRDDNSD